MSSRFDLPPLGWCLAICVFFLTAYLLAPVFGPGASGPLLYIMGDKLDSEMRRLAGRNAINCGQVAIDADSIPVSACVARALREHRALRVRYQTVCFDQVCAEGFVAAPDGKHYLLRFGGGDSRRDQYVRVIKCAEPFDPGRVPPGANATCFAVRSGVVT